MPCHDQKEDPVAARKKYDPVAALAKYDPVAAREKYDPVATREKYLNNIKKIERTKQWAEEHSAQQPLTQQEADSIAANTIPPIPHEVDGQPVTKIAIGIANDWQVDRRTMEHYPPMQRRLAWFGSSSESARGVFDCF